MTVLALHQAQITLWAVALGIGAAVAIVVIGLLTLLHRLVADVEDGVARLSESVSGLAESSAAAEQLGLAAAAVDDVREELGAQRALLERR